MSLRDKSERVSDQQLARYLLGLVHEEEAERLDEASIADDEVASRLRVVENDLVDAYASGSLTGEMLEGFETHYLASPRRRENVTFARSFARAVNRAAPEGIEKSEPDGASRPGSPSADRTASRSKLALRLIATAALLLVACGMLLSRVARTRNGPDVARKEAVALDSRVREQGQRPGEQRAANAAVTRERERLPEPASAPASQPAQEAQTIALVLLPQTRAAVDPIPTLTLGPGVDRVTFELRLESNDFPQYHVALNDPASNETVWRSDPVTVTSPDRAPTVLVTVPTRVLKPQHYSLALIARSGSGANVVGSYTFQVVRR